MMQTAHNLARYKFSCRLVKQHGLNLIEVLISMLVLAVGILGVVSLQSVSIQEGVASQYNARVQMITEELVDVLYANSDGARSGNYVGTFDSTAADAATDCLSSSCSAAQLADYDLRQIASRMAAEQRIPDASFSLSFDTVVSEYSVAFTWNADGDDNYAAAECDSEDDNSNVGCIYTVVRI